VTAEPAVIVVVTTVEVVAARVARVLEVTLTHVQVKAERVNGVVPVIAL
jgi:hypothetical protein